MAALCFEAARTALKLLSSHQYKSLIVSFVQPRGKFGSKSSLYHSVTFSLDSLDCEDSRKQVGLSNLLGCFKNCLLLSLLSAFNPFWWRQKLPINFRGILQFMARLCMPYFLFQLPFLKSNYCVHSQLCWADLQLILSLLLFVLQSVETKICLQIKRNNSFTRDC